MTVLDTPRVDTIILDETILKDEPNCESAHCRRCGRGSHRATFTVRLTCGSQMLACATRVREYRATDHRIKCTKCGGQVHMTADFGYTPL
jgi:ribosomal protein S27AE